MFKVGLKKCTKGDLETCLARFLFQYRITPYSTTTGISPAELLMGRKPKSHLDLLKPNIDARVEDKQERHKTAHDQHAKDRAFQTGDTVYIQNHGSSNSTRKPGKVISQHGQMMYNVNGQVTRRHVDDIHIKNHGDQSNKEDEADDNALPDI